MSKSSLPPHWNGLQISASRPDTLRDQIVLHFRDSILQGFLRKGARLPSTRQLSAELRVSRQTVVSAYERLMTEELIESRRGDGAYVSIDFSILREGKRRIAAQNSLPSPLSARAQQLLDLPITTHPSDKRGLLTPGIPSLDEFPWSTWRKAGAQSFWGGDSDRLDRTAPLGAEALREAIASHIAFSRGVVCEPDQILVTAGAHNAIDLISRVIFDPGDIVWLEDPSYVAGRGTLIANGARLHHVPVDRHGLIVSEGRALALAARAAFVTPSHQYPLGVTMSRSRRIELLEWAEEQRSWIVENDYDSDFRYEGKPPPSLYRLARNYGDRVVYVGTFSNALAPGLRLGFLVAPPALIDALKRARIFSARQPPEPLQTQLAEFISRGDLAAHLRKMGALYKKRRDAVFNEFDSRRSSGLAPGSKPPASGLHFVVRLADGDDRSLCLKALEKGINVPPLSAFFSDPGTGDRGLVIGFAATPIAPARRAVSALCGLAGKHFNRV